MLLEKSDLDQIEKIVEKSAEETKKELKQEIKATVEKSAEETKKELRQEIKLSEGRVISVINREVGDLAEINRAVIQKVSKIDDLEKRIIRIEHKVGIVG